MNFILLLFALLGLNEAASSTDKDRYCAACHLIVDEIEYEISKVDPAKTLDIESFRVDPNGNQKRKQVSYARSETHLTEITESLCQRMKDYAESVDKTGKIKYVSTKSRDGQPIQLENVSISAAIGDKLQSMCENIIEDNDENLIEFFKKPSKEPKLKFCSEVTDLCPDDNEEENDDENKVEL
ncbi:protein canopy homolog 2 isoform X2 [Hydra vulgaris]|uniref:Protein canopy homolog 2 isoform X2 n=1 Tax=Hydra vulgaris TaxID=6087 RepID=A0ABM4CV77_HYDVU